VAVILIILTVILIMMNMIPIIMPTASPTQIIITFGTIGLVVVSLAAHGLIGKSE